MPDAGALTVVAGAVFAGAVLNSLAGFGFALITVPVLTIAVGPKEAVVISAVVGLLSNSILALRWRRDLEVPVAKRLLCGSLLGMPLGVLVLANIAVDPLKVLIAVAVIVSAAVLATGRKLSDPRPGTDVGAGFLSGLFNTSIGISGPPVVMLLQGRAMTKAPFRATSVVVFSTAGVVALGLFAIAGRFDRPVVVASAVAIPVLPLGWLVGSAAHRHFDEEPFRVLVLVLMVITAVLALLSVLAS